jgi:phosphatidylserine/phosphatidylglycerophosphate/cardiolipin synthase-like enzyme
MAEGGEMKKEVILFGFLMILFSALSVLASPVAKVEIITDRDYFPTVQKSLRKAKNSIQVMMFEASYYEKYPDTPSNILIRELIAAQKKGVKVEIILEVREGGQERTTQRNRNTGKILSHGGVEVIYDPLTVTTHAKLIIIDGKVSILGSTNWTYHSLIHNHETNILIKSDGVAKKLQDYFYQVKKSGYKLH